VPSLVNFPAPVAVAAVATTGATEKVIATSDGVNPDSLETQVTVLGFVEITTNATAATAVVVKVRRGSTTAAAQVGTTITVSSAAGTKYCIPFMVTEAPGAGGPMVYSVTTSETGGGANVGTVDAAVIATILSTPN
jgi:hypothetical protein